jgi:hypothetical protein
MADDIPENWPRKEKRVVLISLLLRLGLVG